MTETNNNPTDSNQFQNYTLNSSITESGFGFTGTLGLIYQPTSWMRLGLSYGLPTWFFMNENSNSALTYSFDSSAGNYIPTQYNTPFTYRLRLPMKGTLGASFYFAENSFFSADYSIQNVGATHYSVPNDSFQLAPFYNTYMKNTYTYTHTVKAGIQYGSYNESVQTATAGIGLVFKRFYIDMSYIFTYTKDGLSPNYQDFQVPLDEIHSTYMTHSILLTVGVRIPAKGDKNATSTPTKKQRSGDQLPRYIDPGDKY
jgi:hypothetical protein